MKANYRNSILNLTNSLLRHYNVTPLHPTLSIVDENLKHNPRNVILLILDGMGNHYLEKFHKNGILNQNKKAVITSVFPCTTTAAIKTYESGLMPLEHGNLGWTLYFKETGKYINMLPYRDDETLLPIKNDDFNYKELLKYETIFTKIGRKNPDLHQHIVYPDFIKNDFAYTTYHGYKDFNDLCHTLEEITNGEGKNFVYAYSDNPDYLMHEYGPSCEKVHQYMENVQESLTKLVPKLTDTIMIICADHGQIDVEKNINLYEYEDLYSLLEVKPFIEPRCCSFIVKPGKQEEFQRLFNQYFKDIYKLYTKEEFLASNLLGYGVKHEQVDNFIVDFVGVATGYSNFITREGGVKMKGHHAGFTDEENEVPLIIFNL